MKVVDIVPYTAEEADALGRVLVKAGCPTFGPATGFTLLRVVEGIDVILKREGLSSQMREVLGSFRARLMDVVAVGGAMQGEALQHLESLVKGRGR
jgi:hypothetical protein